MKKLTILSILFISLVFVAPMQASAATNAGVKPGSFFYFFDTTFEKINLFFTFSPEKKARKALEYADERLAEAEAVVGNTEAVKTAVTNYENNIAFAAEKSKSVTEKEKSETLLTLIADNTSKHQEVLTNVLDKVPDEAKEAILKAIEVSKDRQTQALAEILELKKTITELQQEVDSLKEGGQSNQSKEIEELRKEVEALKSSKSSAPSLQLQPVRASTPTSKLSNAQIINKVKPAVVYIQAGNSAGSGMIFQGKYVLTNAHVVKGITDVKISLATRESLQGAVIGRDEAVDLALIQLHTTKQLPSVDFGDSDKTEQGDNVFTFGFPFGIEGDVSFKEGTISRRIEGFFETSAEIHSGNSGGPLVNAYGQVVGINTAKFGESIGGIQLGETIKLAIPINTAINLIPELQSGRNIVVESKEEKRAKQESENRTACLAETEQYYNRLVGGIEQLYSRDNPELQSLISDIDREIESIRRGLNDDIARITNSINNTISELRRIAESRIRSIETSMIRSGSYSGELSSSQISQINSVNEQLNRDVAYYESQKQLQISSAQLSSNSQIQKYEALKSKAYSDQEKNKAAALENAKNKKAEYYTECINSR